MKITKSQIKKIIQEEIAKVREGNFEEDTLIPKNVFFRFIMPALEQAMPEASHLDRMMMARDAVEAVFSMGADMMAAPEPTMQEGNYPNSPLVAGMEKEYAMALSTVLGISPKEVESMSPMQIGELGTSIRNHYRNKLNKRPPPMADPRRAGKYTPREVNEGYTVPPSLDDILDRLSDRAQRQQVKTDLEQSGVFQLDPIEDKEKIKSIINRMRGNSTDQVLDFILVTIADEVLKVRV